jgi:hypothetical protein
VFVGRGVSRRDGLGERRRLLAVRFERGQRLDLPAESGDLRPQERNIACRRRHQRHLCRYGGDIGCHRRGVNGIGGRLCRVE